MTRRLIRLVACCLMMHATWPVALRAQPAAPAAAPQAAAGSVYNTQQLDALLAPVALYPDPLLTQLLMASTFPLQVVEAGRWVEDPANKSLTGDALSKALDAKPWDPSVKSLVPFPQVLSLMNGNLEWLQQLGYAFADQQAAVLDSVQRLRRQAQGNGSLQSSPQQVVRTEQQTIIIEPTESNTVYVPSYNPTQVYGAWPYPSYPPVYLPPPVGYPVGTALATGLAFGAGIAITAGLWNWARPVWGGGYGGGYVNVNVNRYNNINANRAAIRSDRWQANRPGGRPAGLQRPPGGPVGGPARPGGLPPGAIGRPNVSVPGNAVRPQPGGGLNRPGGIGQGPGNRPGGIGQGPGNRPGLGQPGAGVGGRPGLGQPGAGAGGRPGLGQPGGIGGRPGFGQPGAGAGFGGRPGGNQPIANRPVARPPMQGGAFAGMNDGRRAQQFGQRGGQSRSFGAQRPSGGGRAMGGRGGGGRGGRR